jgi:hypothetical protein
MVLIPLGLAVPRPEIVTARDDRSWRGAHDFQDPDRGPTVR